MTWAGEPMRGCSSGQFEAWIAARDIVTNGRLGPHLDFDTQGPYAIWSYAGERLLFRTVFQQIAAGRDLDIVPDHTKWIVALTNDFEAAVTFRDPSDMTAFSFEMADRGIGLPKAPAALAARLEVEYSDVRR